MTRRRDTSAAPTRAPTSSSNQERCRPRSCYRTRPLEGDGGRRMPVRAAARSVRVPRVQRTPPRNRCERSGNPCLPGAGTTSPAWAAGARAVRGPFVLTRCARGMSAGCPARRRHVGLFGAHGGAGGTHGHDDLSALVKYVLELSQIPTLFDALYGVQSTSFTTTISAPEYKTVCPPYINRPIQDSIHD